MKQPLLTDLRIVAQVGRCLCVTADISVWEFHAPNQLPDRTMHQQLASGQTDVAGCQLHFPATQRCIS